MAKGNEVDEVLAYLEESLEATKKQIENDSRGGGGGDERLLKLASNNCKVRVRILPPLPTFGILTPWVKKYIHMFNSAATDELMTYDCPWSESKPCKICMNNKMLWDAGDEASKNLARKYKRKDSFAVNVFIRDNSANPDDAGKVKVYRFPKKVYEKMKTALESIGPFYSPTEAGADFIIDKRIVKTEDREFANYDNSMFIPGIPLADSKDEMAEILRQCHDLSDFAYKEPTTDPMLKKAFEVHVLGKFEEDNGETTDKVDPVADQAPPTTQEEPEIKNFKDEEKELKAPPKSDESGETSVDEDALFKEIMEDINK